VPTKKCKAALILASYCLTVVNTVVARIEMSILKSCRWLTLFAILLLLSHPAANADSPTSLPDVGLSLGRGAETGDLESIVGRRTLRILTVYGPGRYYLDNGPQGVTAEYATRLGNVLNEAYETGHLKVLVVAIPVARDELFDALMSGRGDIVIAGTTITDARRASVDFTIPVSKPLKEIVVTGPTAPTIRTLEDFSGKTIYVRGSSSYAESIKQLNKDLKAQNKPPAIIEPISELLEDEDLIEMVNAGLLPWAVVDSYKPTMWQDVFTKVTIRDDLVFREGGRLAWAVRKNNPELKKFLNEFLRDNKEGTLFGNILRNRYVRDFDWASNATASNELQKYRSLERYFREHGETYGIEPALLAAQGFQESRLDQNVRSQAGAIGIMQLLPSTAKDKNVDIPNIHEIEPNIEAGAKYMSFLKDRYFSGPELDSFNGALLSLAAYNAGPAKIRRLRKVASERGYDPNRWFDHVEVIAAEQIGRETVQYVSNIFKYYLSYKLVDRQSERRERARLEAGVE
jgi:membrane-bound lytic murein transglycosylase MltF